MFGERVRKVVGRRKNRGEGWLRLGTSGKGQEKIWAAPRRLASKNYLSYLIHSYSIHWSIQLLNQLFLSVSNLSDRKKIMWFPPDFCRWIYLFLRKIESLSPIEPVLCLRALTPNKSQNWRVGHPIRSLLTCHVDLVLCQATRLLGIPQFSWRRKQNIWVEYDLITQS